MNTNIYDISRNQRDFGGNVVGTFGRYSLNATIDHREYFFGDGRAPRCPGTGRASASRAMNGPCWARRCISPPAASTSTSCASALTNDVETDSRSLGRVDFSPQVRYPFKKWQWFTVNSTVGWRDTFYTRSLSAKVNPTEAQVVTEDDLNRRFFTLQANILGPLFNRIWDTPTNGYAEKFKHAIEPFLNINKTSSVDNFDRIVVLDGIDSIVGGTSYTYGVNNRFYAKRKAAVPGGLAQAREIVSVELSQTYNTNQLATLYDRQYQSNNVPGSVDASRLISRRSRSASVRCRPTRSPPTCARSSTPATTR